MHCRVINQLSLRVVAGSVAVFAASCPAGMLLDYGYQDSFNEAGIVRGEGTPSGASGFAQFQSFTVTAEAWRLDSAALRLTLWDMFSSGDADIAIYAAADGVGGTIPDLAAGPISETFAISAGSLQTERVAVGLGGTVLGRGTYYVGLTAADPLTELAWLPGTTVARHHAVREDGQVFSSFAPALSLTLEGEVVPAAPTAALLALGGLTCCRRRGAGGAR